MNNNWNELSMRDKAAFIRMGVANGYKDIDSIRLVYNEFRGGGKKKSPVTNRKLAFLKDLELSLKNNSRYNTAQWRKYLTDLAYTESSFTPDSVNSIGAKGYFQLMPANRSKTWNTPTLLFEELYKLNDSNLKYFERNMTEQDHKRAQELGIDIYGLMAGAHLGGAKNVMKALRGQSNAKDANNTSVLGYMKKFSLTGTNKYRPSIDIEMPLYPVEYPDNLRVSPTPILELYMIDNNSPTSYNSPLLQGVSDNEIASNAKIVDEINNILANRNDEDNDYLLDTKDSSDLEAMANGIILNSIPLFNTPYILDNAQYKEPTYYTATDILRAQAQNELETLLNEDFENTIYDNLFDNGGNVETPLEYTHRRFPITEQFDVHPYLDATFTPRDIGNFGDIEYMTAEHNTLPYYNNYSKPDSLLNKSVIVYNDKLGENTNEAVALDALSHGLRELDDTWKNKYIPTLLTTFLEDATYYADKYNVPNRLEFIDSYVDGKIRAMMVEDKYREALNYPSRNELIEEYYNSTPLLLNALTEAYSYINPILLPEVTVIGKKHKFGGNLFQNGGDTIDVEGYPIVSSDSEGLTEWFNNTPNVAGMAIGAGLNNIDGNRRVVLNPNLKDINARNSVYRNESYRHFFDENNTTLPEVTDIQREAYIGTPYEGLDRRIQETEAARYLSGDPSHHLNDEQKTLLDKFRFTYLGGTLPEVIVTGKKKYNFGGNIFDGTSLPTLLMNRANIFRRPNGEYFYLASPESEEITVIPLNTLFDDPALWTYTDANGSIYSPRLTTPTSQGTIIEKKDAGPIVEAAKNYLGELQYDINNNIPIGGKYTMPAIAASALLPLAGETFAGTSIAGIPATTWADTALTSGFGAHGLNHAINEGIDGWGDAAMTALEIAPLGRLAKPVYNTITPYINSAYNKLPWTYRIPENPNMAYRRMEPLERDWLMEGNELSTRETNALTEAEREAAVAAEKAANPNRRFVLFKAGAEHGGRKQFAKGQPWRGTTVTHGEEQVLAIPGEGLPWVSGRHYKGPQGTGFRVGDVPFEEAPFGSHIDLLTEEGYTGVNPSLLDGSVIYSPFKIFGHNFGYKKLYPRSTTQQITAENAASITPEQWTAVQDAAIARGDMVEAQRLRDLHFQFTSEVNPKTVYRGGKSNPREGTIVKYQNDDPVKYPTPYVFNHSDLTPEPYRNLSADRGIYFTDNEPYALKFTRTRRGTEGIFNPQHVGSYYLNIKSPYKAAPDTEPIWFGTVKDIYSKPDFHSKYDGIIGKDMGFINDSGNVYVVRSSNQAKLSDAVTYDDNGVRIPLGERDIFNLNDTRYSWLTPIISIGTFGTLLNKKQ